MKDQLEIECGSFTLPTKPTRDYSGSTLSGTNANTITAMENGAK